MKPVILVFEEHDESRMAVSKSLTAALPEYDIVSAGNLKEALAIVHSQPPTIVLIGIDLLQGNHLKDVEEIKSAASGAQIVVIATNEDEVYRTETPAEVSAYILKGGLTSFLKRMFPYIVGCPSVSA